MDTQKITKRKVIRQIEKVPEDRLNEVFDFLKRMESSQRERKTRILSYAGVWADMKEDDFKELNTQITTNRRKSREERL